MTKKDADHQRPPATIGDEMGSSHIYFVIGNYSRTFIRPVGNNRYKLEGSAKTCRRTVGDWSLMGGDLCVKVGDSCTIIIG